MPITLVTGAPGWIGTRLVEALLAESPEPRTSLDAHRDNRVRCLVQPAADTGALPTSSRLDLVPGDVRDPASLEAFFKGAEGAILFHCAGIVHPARFVRELKEVNVAGTRHLLQGAASVGVRRAVILSSNSPCGANPRRDHRFDEHAPYRPYMAYGRSKMRLEQIALEFHARGLLETVILRPVWFYGPNQPLRQTSFFRMIRNGSAPIVGDGENMRSMVYIDNLCQALLLSQDHPSAGGQTYWIADERPYSMNEIVGTVERLMETEFGLRVSHRRLRLPSLASELAWLGDACLQAVGLYEQRVHVLSEMNKTIACSVDKARHELGYAPEVELEEGMRRSLAWCVSQGIEL